MANLGKRYINLAFRDWTNPNSETTPALRNSRGSRPQWNRQVLYGAGDRPSYGTRGCGLVGAARTGSRRRARKAARRAEAQAWYGDSRYRRGERLPFIPYGKA